MLKIFTEILKATPINFIVSYFSFIVQTNLRMLMTMGLTLQLNFEV